MNLKALDALRGLLAVCVLLGHARWLLWEGHAKWLASVPPWWEYPIAFASASFGIGIVLAVASLSDSATRAFPIRILAWLGIRSYSIYIFHFPFVAILAAYVFSMFGGRPLHGWFAVVGALVALTLSCICFELCERQFLHRRSLE